mmetsp:Transcript_15478/g.18350  ORF Transcript_15478/g.18350 Transcript_15478/m.18350 type:complete len:616 (+) Transcript_15478:19-1866(+)
MLDQVSLFSKSGVVLWSKTWTKIKNTVAGEHPVDALVKGILLEDKGGDRSAAIESYQLKWTFANEFDLVIVVVYQKLLQCIYAEELLDNLKSAFVKNFASEFKRGLMINSNKLPIPFDEHFEKCLRRSQNKFNGSKKTGSTGASSGSSSSSSHKNNQRKDNNNDDNVDENENDDDISNTNDKESGSLDETMSARAKLRARVAANKGGGASGGSKKSSSNSGKASSGKEGTVWRDGSSSKKKLSKSAELELDFSKKNKNPENGAEMNEDDERLKEYQEKYLPDTGEQAEWEEEDSDLEDEAEQEGWFKKSAVGSFLQTITGNKVLEDSDLEPIFNTMRHQLIGKNVASEIANEVCDSVKANLEGQKLASFTRVKSEVIRSLKESVVRVLTPRKSTDLLYEVNSHKGKGTPYVVCFVGINGVGKSTSLAKVCYYLKQHGVKVMMAACDTFRSGAVEQLRGHAKCLDVPLFEKGYLKDPGEVAKMAINEAKATGYDCVLVDTAGRMQNNDKLMRELAKLVQINKPNMLLFVGEALVGNDGINQLQMFNKALSTYLPSGESKGIDGIVLTKFDTIDDKVGATLSMSYKTGQPVMFVGTGQKYTHLKKLNVNSVVKSLFA